MGPGRFPVIGKNGVGLSHLDGAGPFGQPSQSQGGIPLVVGIAQFDPRLFRKIEGVLQLHLVVQQPDGGDV